MTAAKIFTLPTVGSSTESASLRSEIEAGLLGTEEWTVPGAREQDKAWAYRRSVPTVVLYDEKGLRLYDQITAKAPEYYLFPDELDLLKTFGPEIARSMGFPKKVPLDDEDHLGREPLNRWKPARWGDAALGKWNNGVNGEEGLGGGFERGWDVVELGAGALRKTAHLLTALSSTLPDEAASNQCPITYHALDLSYPELNRVLGEMNESFGPQLKNKVECFGLHGDYEAGLQFIRDGKLASVRTSLESKQTTSERSVMNAVPAVQILDMHKNDVDSLPGTPPSDEAVVTPGPEAIYALSAYTVTDGSSITSAGLDSASGTWSSVGSDDTPFVQSSSPLPEPNELHGPVAGDESSVSKDRPLHFMFLGSSIGNFSREDAGPFLRSLPLRSGDTLLLGLDGRPKPGSEGRHKLEAAYNDPAGHTRAFEEHGWDVVRNELSLVDDPGMEFVGRYNEVLGRHEAYFKSRGAQTIHLPSADRDVHLKQGELLNIEWSYKYSINEAINLFRVANLRVINSWKAPDSEYRLWLLERPPTTITATHDMITRTVSLETVQGVPKWEEWVALWKVWDHITLEMIPPTLLHQKPIDLRHICLFYLGHIPAFLDIHLTRLTGGEHTEPKHFKDIFERGIDPNVDDPTIIHDHSEVPQDEEDWPTLEEILTFRDRVVQRLHDMYNQIASGQLQMSRKIGRVLWMTFEHQAMHAETILYMLAQSSLTLPPRMVTGPHWQALAERWKSEQLANTVITVSAGSAKLGHNDLEADDVKFPTEEGWEDHEFGWDNENPAVEVPVQAFKIDALPVTNNDYLAFLKSKGINWDDAQALPASWIQVDGEWKIRSLYGPISFVVGGLWPLLASKLEIDAYAKSKGGRLPTEPELVRLWEIDEGTRTAGNLANVGLRNWHPIPPALTITDNDGQILHGHNGGAWEWTSTELAGHQGYTQSLIYPGYSYDFFDGKHYVVLGGSYATIPSIARRKAFRNFFQANYRFSFITGRVAYDQ